MGSSTAPEADVAPALRLDIARAGPGGSTVLGPLSLEIGAREVVALTGPSGVGKTTLLRVIAGLEPGYEGSRSFRGRLAMVFQEPTLLPWRTAVQNITIATGTTLAEAQLALGAVGLGALADRYPGQLSLGQQRRLALARAFAARPDLILLDEPFVSLDPALADEMMGLLADLIASRPVAALIVTHVRAEAERLAGRILRLDGTPARLIEDA